MGKNKIFSAIMILAAVFTVASGQCYPGKVVGLNKGDTICATANCLGIDCDVMIKYLQVHYHAQIVSGCLNDSALIVTLPTKAAIDSLIAQKNVAAPKKAKAKAKTRGQKNSPATEFEKITGPGPAQWINYGVDPWRGDPLAAWCMLGFSQYISALDSMKAAFARDDYVRDSISN
ncbi:MAG TPA: hypothetical protein VMC41_00075, partial [Candidatus Nanoarchaeia archaeon]|nr:hypothetical protein [Candidatus Nanoarchaeia archaeon]